MNQEIKCQQCGEGFIPENLNNVYCSIPCYKSSKAIRQKNQRDPIKRFIAIMTRNHEILDKLFSEGYDELSQEELKYFKIDISMCRLLKPGNILDFGDYALTPDQNIQSFKLQKNDSSSTI
jgi:hypothetical protein